MWWGEIRSEKKVEGERRRECRVEEGSRGGECRREKWSCGRRVGVWEREGV